KDGKLYILEYGQKWFSKNLDARLIAINYNSGNRPPVAKFEVDKEVGAAPLKVRFSAKESLDFDQDKINYSWSINNKVIESTKPIFEYTFQEAGIYDIELKVSDPSGSSGTVNKKIMVGNEPPTIDIALNDANTIYWRNKSIDYEIQVSDREDGNTTDRSLDPSKVKVTLNYIPEGEDLILASLGHQQNVVPKGLELIETSGCKACHSVTEEVAGPSYMDVAKRYDKSDKETLISRIIKGSQGIWGERIMIANPHLEIEEAEEIVNYILSLDSDQHSSDQLIPLNGQITFDQHENNSDGGKYILMASYLDEGNPEVEGSALSTVEQIVFQSTKLQLENTEGLDEDLGIWEKNKRTLVGSIIDGKQIKIQNISFKNLNKIKLAAFFDKKYAYKGEVEIRVGSKKGKLLGTQAIDYFDKKEEKHKIYEIPLEPSDALDDLVIVFKHPEQKKRFVLNADWLELVYE
ncbi:MAG: PKD domain-containing protein, partial [Saprospiraceae bacterium]